MVIISADLGTSISQHCAKTRKPPTSNKQAAKNAKSTRAKPPTSRRVSPPPPPPAGAARPLLVALGASAGGLAVFERLLHLVPTGGNLAFLLVSHLDPAQESLLTELLAPHTTLTVVKAESGARVEADHVYVIPPDRYMTVKKGVVQLSPIKDARGARFPIDVLLRSLAEDQKENAVGVILTGTGADGTDGLRTIKDNGGIVIVQDPTTVDYAGMPSSAIATGVVDFVLPVEQMPEVLLGYARHAYANGYERKAAPSLDETRELNGVFSVLKARGDPLDHRAYKTGTLMRRIHRRMGLAQIDRIGDYVALLRQDPDEVERLRKDLLITVTHFFRDPEAWKLLERDVVPRLFDKRGPDTPIRVWVPGCSSGEEAYSIAMVLLDHRRARKSTVPIQIFATDVGADLLDVARAASYDKSSVAHIPAKRRDRYFTQEAPDRYRATKQLRETIAFAAHNLLSDPPFSQMDLVCCRNVLIYFQPAAQRKIVGLFRFALKQGGYLFLGGSEAVTPDEGDLESVSKKWRIYKRTGKRPPGPLGFPSTVRPITALAMGAPSGADAARRPAQEAGLAQMAQRWLVEAYAPAAVVVDGRFDILYVHGALGAFLELPRGEPVLNLVAMAPERFHGRLRAALHKARSTGESRDVSIAYKNPDGSTRSARLSIRVYPQPTTSERLMLVAFEDVPRLATDRSLRRVSAEEGSLTQQLEQELAATKADLQGTIEALETANEELRATNEEITSMNEEFRSTNEELETSKEELQSLNEELSTVNSQLREKVQALELVTNDLTNLLTSTDIPTLFLDPGLRIRRFTPGATALFSLIPSDLGRPITDISMTLADDTFLQDLRRVGHSLTPTEKEIRAHAGHRYLRRIRPYQTLDDRIDGAVVTYIDVEAMKLAEEKASAAGRYAQEIVETVREPLIVLDARSHVQSANQAFYEMFRTTPGDTVGRLIYSLRGGPWKEAAFRDLLERVLPEKREVRDLELQADLGPVGRRTLLLNSRRFRLGAGEPEELILLAVEDISDRRLAQEELEARVKSRTAEVEKSNRNLQHVNESLDAFSHVVGHDLKEPARAVEALLHVLEQDHTRTLSPAGRQILGDARAANERLGRLIVGLLELSRASRIDFPNLRPVGIAEAIRSDTCRTRFDRVLSDREARLELPAADVRVQATHDVLSQILGNLILNGIKHNPRPKPHVRVRAESRAEDMIEVVVEDDGPGFPADLVAGFDTMSTTTRGFGLLIARRAVENLGGRMWLAQAEGGGGAVHFTLRAAAAQ